MAMLAVPVSHDISRLFQSIDVEAQRDPSDHITMFYFGDDLDVKKASKMLPVIFECTQEMKPFTCGVQKITTFPEGKYGYPVIAEVKSKELTDFRTTLKKAFDTNKIKYDDKFPEYKPHITLGYSKDKIKDIKVDKFTFSVQEVALYGGDSHDEKLFINFPFSLGYSKTKKANILSMIYKRATMQEILTQK